MKVAVYGAGAMGTVLGAFLAKVGEQIDLISRNKTHIKALQTDGARITGSVDFTQKVNALLPSEMEKQYDIIFLMTKQLDNKQVVESLVPFLEEDGVICTMQNGIPELSVSEVIGEERTYGCTMAWGASVVGDGVVKLTSANTPETLSFGLGSFHNKTTPHLNEIKRLLSIMGSVTVEENFMGTRWAKLLINSGFNGLSAIFGATLGEIVENKVSRRIFQKLLKECIDVAKKNDIKIENVQGFDIVKLLDYQTKIKETFSYVLIPIMVRKHKASKSSTCQDIEKGKKTEIEAINGVIAFYGNKVWVDTPFNDRVISLVKDLEEQKIKQGMENLKLFEDLLQ
ncbi:ketopantoate reductase family protein [Fredinandcohnia sp. 179-A 10B2 NHS]|uniref:ketopantoate reductase family protein n=1 Tax=Fredinandcohnia sp. 179-A 10B2 NHS TaxID=3235176 RepID=UPI0039A1C1A3